MLLAALQELLDAGEAAERDSLYVSTKPNESGESRMAYRIHATTTEYDEIVHLLGTLRNATNT